MGLDRRKQYIDRRWVDERHPRQGVDYERLYGHLDKQPEMAGCTEARNPLSGLRPDRTPCPAAGGTMRRRTALVMATGAITLYPRLLMTALAQAKDAPATLLAVPLAVQGAWKWPKAADQVLERMREVCLTGVRLLSDQQPDRILVDDHTSGPPSIWLHDDGTRMAWIILDVAGSDWCKTSYQFGHELGHVLCNSWGPLAKPQNPCQWLEEALVESFSLRGLGLLAKSWETNPPFPGNEAFAGAIRQYRADRIAKYRKVAVEEGAADSLASWFRTHRSSLAAHGGVTGPDRGAIPTFLGELETDNGLVEGLGAMNRWPARTGVPIEDYLRFWEKSCSEIGASNRLPLRLRSLLLGS
jgi:hypothetical protein